MKAFLLLLLVGNAFAQSYPDKPVRLLLTFAAGGQADILARSVAEKINKGNPQMNLRRALYDSYWNKRATTNA